MKLIQYVHRTVTQGDWNVSSTTGTGINGAILHVYRSRIGAVNLPVSKWLKGYGDGRLFASTDEANQFAFEHGYLQLYFTCSKLRANRKAEGRYRFKLLADGGFAAGDTATGFTAYAYPSSLYADSARVFPNRAAREMVLGIIPSLHRTPAGREYDARNWARIRAGVAK